MIDQQHLKENELAGFLDGDLSPAERARVEAHLEACDRCRAELVAVARTAHDFSTADPEWSAAASPARRRWRIPAGIGGLAAAAAIAFLFLSPARPPVQDGWSPPGLNDRPVQERLGGEGVARIETHFPSAGGLVRRDALRFSWADQGSVPYRITLTAEDGALIWTATLEDTTAVPPADLALAPGETFFWYVDAIDIGVIARTGARPFTIAP